MNRLPAKTRESSATWPVSGRQGQNGNESAPQHPSPPFFAKSIILKELNLSIGQGYHSKTFIPKLRQYLEANGPYRGAEAERA